MATEDRAARLLSFRAGCRSYSIPLDQVSGLADCGPIRSVFGAPPEVLGLSEWRGRLLTVLDLPGLLGEPESAGPMCLICLAGTMTRTALRVPAPVFLQNPGSPATGDRPILVDPVELVSRLETEIMAGNSAAGN